MDNFSAPRFDLLFRPQEYTPKPNEDANFMGNIAALQDPSGTLARKQAELVAKNMAQVKTDDIRGEFQKFALDEIQRNLDDELKMYQSNKGFNRLALGGDQLLTKQKRDKELIGKVGALRQLSDSYEKAMERAAVDVYKETITADDYKAFDESLKKRMKEATGIGDIPDALGEYNLFLNKIPKNQVRTLKDEMEFQDNIFKLYKQWNYTEGGTKGRNAESVRANIENTFPSGSYQWMVLDRELQAKNFYPPETFTEADKKAFLTKASISGYNPSEATRGNTNVNISPSWEKNWKPKYRIVDTPNGKELNFNGSPTSDGIIVTDQIVGDAGEVVNPGDLFVPKKTFLRGGERYVAGVTVSKGNIVKANSDGVELSSGATFKPVTVRIDDNMRNIIESNYFKPDRDGYPDTSVWGRLQTSSKTGSSAQQPATEKTYTMAAALKKYQGFTEAQIRERMSQLGYKEVK